MYRQFTLCRTANDMLLNCLEINSDNLAHLSSDKLLMTSL